MAKKKKKKIITVINTFKSKNDEELFKNVLDILTKYINKS